MASKILSAQSYADWQSTKKTVSERTRHMFNNSEMSDISFTCKGSDKTFYAHKYVLATSSGVFKAMFYGALAEKNQVLYLTDTDERSLEEFLRFLYTDECDDLTADNIVSVVYLSKKYIVPSLTEYLIAHLIKYMEPENVLNILELAIQIEEKYLENKCWQFIELRANEVIVSETFNNISQKTLASLLERNILNVSEVNLFKAVLKWSDFQCSQKSIDSTTKSRRSVLGEAVYNLRLLAMNQEEFAKHVSTSGLLYAEELVPIYEKFNKLQSPSLKWTLTVRGKTIDTSERKIRFSRFSKNDYFPPLHSPEFISAKRKPDTSYRRDSLRFSIDQCALFLGVRLFGNREHEVTLEINGEDVSNREHRDRVLPPSLSGESRRGKEQGCSVSGTYRSNDERDVRGFYVILKSPILVKKDEVVNMKAIIKGSPLQFGWHGKSKVEVKGITVTFIDSVAMDNNNSTCVSQGQFHEIILSV